MHGWLWQFVFLYQIEGFFVTSILLDIQECTLILCPNYARMWSSRYGFTNADQLVTCAFQFQVYISFLRLIYPRLELLPRMDHFCGYYILSDNQCLIPDDIILYRIQDLLLNNSHSIQTNVLTSILICGELQMKP